MTEKLSKENSSGGGQKKAGSGSSKVKHNRPADMMNITNGVQRMQIGSKNPEHHPRTSPTIEQRSHRHHQPHVVEPNQSGAKIRQKGSKPAGARPKSDAFAQNVLYAGAGFDISPAASSLPIPKFGRPSSDGSRPATMRPMGVEDLLKSGQAFSAPGLSQTTPMSPLAPSQPVVSEADQLRMKSEYLLKVLSKPDHDRLQSPPGLSSREQHAKPPPNTEQLEEMTAQVRRLLNL